MQNSRRIRTAADVALGYGIDGRGKGVAYASIATGSSSRVVRLAFAVAPVPALEDRAAGYAAIAVAAQYLKNHGFGRVRIRLADAQVARELNGLESPPKVLAMAYVRARCLLHGLGTARLEAAQPIEVRDLATRAAAEITLHAAA